MITSKPVWKAHLSLSELFIAAIASQVVRHARIQRTGMRDIKESRKDRRNAHKLP